jgi:hypothetical protein
MDERSGSRRQKVMAPVEFSMAVVAVRSATTGRPPEQPDQPASSRESRQ